MKDPLIAQRIKAELRETMPQVPLLEGQPDSSMQSVLPARGAIHAQKAATLSPGKPCFEMRRSRKVNKALAAQEPLQTDPALALPSSPAALSALYQSFARAYAAPAKPVRNVVSRIKCL